MTFSHTLSMLPGRRLKVAIVATVAVLAVPLFFSGIFSTQFLPHAYCYVQQLPLITLHVISDLLIWLSYLTITCTLVYLVHKARYEIPFHWMFLAFGLFIVACGFTHLMEVITLWKPVYWLSGYVKVITALASVTTAVALPPLVPKIIALQRNAVLAERRRLDLAVSNRELESFSYSVSHDLRAPLRAINGFSRMVLEEHGDQLGAEGREDMERALAATVRMGELIDHLLMFARTSREEMRVEPIDMSAMARDIAAQLSASDAARDAQFAVAPGLVVDGDRKLLRVALENLLGNAWKFTAREPKARIELGAEQENGRRVFFVRDNGAGFDMDYAEKLFVPFERLHRIEEFPGSGIGLATVLKIVHRHGGDIWAESQVNRGATFYFSLQSLSGGA
jgi:signal transduction histidine kinase